MCRSSLTRICLRSLLFSQYLNQRENQRENERISAPFSVRDRSPWMTDSTAGNKKSHIKLNKKIGIVEIIIFGRDLVGKCLTAGPA